jgi:serine/threonine protein kinase
MAVHVDPFEIVGRRIDGKYEVVEVVDQTSFSVVYRAAHVVWKRDVAIKAFKVAGDFTEEARSGLLASFIREGALLAELSERCTAICQARDMASFTTEAGQWVPYMVLEWVDGEALDLVLVRERAQGSRPRTARDAIALLAPIAEALALAHSRGIVHCDVKPGNILLLREGNDARSHAKLHDFGVAKVLRDSRRDAPHAIVEGTFTPAYAAPEQWSSEHGAQGPATDVFALALIVVELVTGREPFQGDQIDDLARESCDPVRRPTPRALGVAVSDEVERVLSRALALNPANRFANAQQFWDALAAADADLPSTNAERQTQTDVVIPLSRRRPRASSGAAAAFMLCACAAAGWHLSSQSAGHTTWLGAIALSPGSFLPGAERIAALTTPSTYASLLATLCVVANALCMGTLFSVSWMCGRARMMADGSEIGRLAMQLFRRWTVPSLIVCLLSGGGWCALVAQEHPQAYWRYGIALAGLALVGLNVTVGRRASQLVRGAELSRGEGASRFALLLSVWAVVALLLFRPSLLP